jgi:hypothetical protein
MSATAPAGSRWPGRISQGLNAPKEVGLNVKAIMALPLAAALCLLAAPGFSSPPAVESQWVGGPVKIDGLDDDWKDARFALDEGSKAEYALKNDGENLYVIFVFRSPLAATTIDFTGMKVYFDLDGKKKKELGLHFFKKDITGSQLIAAMEKRGEAPTEAQKAEILKGKGYYLFECEVLNAKKVPVSSDAAVKTVPPTYRIGTRERILIYEFRIPLSRTNQPGGLGATPGQTIGLGFEWGGVTKAIMKDTVGMRASMGSRAAARDGGSEAGWRDPGDPGRVAESAGFIPPSEYNRDPRFKKHSFWVEVKLAGPGASLSRAVASSPPAIRGKIDRPGEL